MRPSLRKLLVVFLLIPFLSSGQKRRELKKCIETYKWHYVQNCVFPADTAEMKKAVASWMFLDEWSYNSQTDSSVTFSKVLPYQNIKVNQSWEDQWLAHWYNYVKRKYNGIVTVRVGFHEVKHGMDISVIAYTRTRQDDEYEECLVPELEPALREYLFSALDFEVPIWPEKLGDAVDRYNTTQIYPDRKLALR